MEVQVSLIKMRPTHSYPHGKCTARLEVMWVSFYEDIYLRSQSNIEGWEREPWEAGFCAEEYVWSKACPIDLTVVDVDSWLLTQESAFLKHMADFNASMRFIGPVLGGIKQELKKEIEAVSVQGPVLKSIQDQVDTILLRLHGLCKTYRKGVDKGRKNK